MGTRFMTVEVKALLLCWGMACAGALPIAGQQPDVAAQQEPTPESLKAEIETLKAAKVAWREIAWKRCLLDGLREAKSQGKPALLWVFIDRPADDARC